MQFSATIIAFSLAAMAGVDAIGRNPTAVEQNACRVNYAQQLNIVRDTYHDPRAVVEAYNKGLEGGPCMTSCRMIYGNRNRSIKELDDIFTPNGVQCAQGAFPRFCQKGRCMLPPLFRDETN